MDKPEWMAMITVEEKPTSKESTFKCPECWCTLTVSSSGAEKEEDAIDSIKLND